MLRMLVWMISAAAVWTVAACVPPPEPKPVGPVSETSKMPWNRPTPGEGQAMFGGALQKR